MAIVEILLAFLSLGFPTGGCLEDHARPIIKWIVEDNGFELEGCGDGRLRLRDLGFEGLEAVLKLPDIVVQGRHLFFLVVVRMKKFVVCFLHLVDLVL